VPVRPEGISAAKSLNDLAPEEMELCWGRTAPCSPAACAGRGSLEWGVLRSRMLCDGPSKSGETSIESTKSTPKAVVPNNQIVAYVVECLICANAVWRRYDFEPRGACLLHSYASQVDFDCGQVADDLGDDMLRAIPD
jgi:hypothetical protein